MNSHKYHHKGGQQEHQIQYINGQPHIVDKFGNIVNSNAIQYTQPPDVMLVQSSRSTLSERVVEAGVGGFTAAVTFQIGDAIGDFFLGE